MTEKTPNIKEDKKLQQMFIRKNLSHGRKQRYYKVFKEVQEITGYTPTQLLDIAKKEQQPRIVDNQIEFLEIEDRTITEVQYLFYIYRTEKNLKNTTIKTDLQTYRAFFNEYNVQLPKNIDIKAKAPLYEDGDHAGKKEILHAIHSTNNKRNKALIYFMSSSGIRPVDVRNIKIKHLLRGCRHYLGENATLQDLFDSDYEHIIPDFYFRPQKTVKHNNVCCTFCSNEAMKSIVHYLRTRPKAPPEDYLFASREGGKLSDSAFIRIFTNINDSEFGTNRFGDRFFRAGGLRKYFVTTCNRYSGDLLKVRLLSGHTISNIDRAYNEISIEDMRRFYTSLLPYLNLHDTRVKTVKSKEYRDLEQKLEKQKLENEKLKEELDEKINRVVHNVLEKYR